MSFNIGLSGLRAAQMDLSVTGNNIANASTVGFKQSRAEFGDVYSASILGTGKHSTGSGVLVERVSQQHTQGNINYTDRALDMAIEGNGYFILSNNGQTEYTRAGYFNLDKDGYIINNTGKRLQGYTADDQGNVQGVMGDMRISQTNIEPKATGRLDLEFNFDSRKENLGTLTTIPLNGVANDVILNIDGVGTTLNVDANGVVTPETVVIDGQGYDVVGTAPNIVLKAQIIGSISPGVALELAGNPIDPDDFQVGSFSFNPNDRTTYSDQNPTKVYDSLGIEHVVSQYFVKVEPSNSAEGNAWAMIMAFDGKFVDGNGNAVEFPVGSGEYLTAANFNDWVTGGGDPTTLVQKTLTFNTQGAFSGFNDGNVNTVPPANSPGSFNLSVPTEYLAGAWMGPTPNANSFTYNLRGTTQYGAAFSAQSQSQDGYTTGRLAGLEVGADGSIFGRYTNGQNKVVGQVPIATFTNPEGLRPNGSTAWLESPDSGIPTINVAGTGITGTIAGGALEDSNVDLAEELVKMIIGQRNYQANAKTIQTQDTITQTIINLR
ncbi:flagellar hook protein FlgE [Marinospirillum sp. MEB164]|uniref:Flagellar hook protein FlgE n=1 Tax=Marinospirillum alkalitolerans TaxID=3123374 RepID=A0ABW8PWS7_9GAMM